jgi:RNA polymerase sigma-70 factor (ECF subfamily)
MMNMTDSPRIHQVFVQYGDERELTQDNTPEPRGFEEILVKYSKPLWRLALSLSRYNEMDAKDLFQDSVLRAFRGRDALKKVTYPYAWFRRSFLNTHLNRQRDNKQWNEYRELDEVDTIMSMETSIPDVLINSIKDELWDDEIRKALDKLPESYRTVFLLSDIEGMSREEIAKSFEISEGTVSSRLFRARRALAVSLEKYAIGKGFIKETK